MSSVTENTALWSAWQKTGSDDAAVATRAVVYRTPEGAIMARIENGGDVLHEERVESVEAGKAGCRAVMEESARMSRSIGIDVTERREYPWVGFYVMRFEPYYGQASYTNTWLSLDDAIAAYQTDIERAYGDVERQALNCLGVEYCLPKMETCNEYVGSVDLIQERFDKHLFLSHDFEKMPFAKLPEALHAVAELRDRFNLNEAGRQWVEHEDIDGVHWVVAHDDEHTPVKAYPILPNGAHPVMIEQTEPGVYRSEYGHGHVATFLGEHAFRDALASGQKFMAAEYAEVTVTDPMREASEASWDQQVREVAERHERDVR